MNQLSCLFVSEDIFIINICNEYKAIGDKKLVEVIKNCINFNKSLNSKDPQYLLNSNSDYKGIVIVKNLEDFSSEYVIVECFVKECALSFVKKCASTFAKLSLNATNAANEESDYDFMQFLKLQVQKHMFNTNIEYYNSLFNGDTYLYCLNSCTKLDFDILVHNFLQIVEKETIENIKIELRL